MRLPFLQVFIDDSRQHGEMLALKAKARGIEDQLRLDACWWRGKLEDVWDAGVKASGDRRPDGILRGDDAAEFLARSIRYPGPPEELEGLLIEARLATRTRVGLKIKGVDELYGPSWDKKNRNSGNGRKGAKARWNHAVANAVAIPVQHGNKKTETETEKNTTTTNLVLVEVPSTPPTREVFEHWRKATGKVRAVLDRKRQELIDRRLAEGHLAEDLKAAIDGYARSPFHNGQNDKRKKYLSLDLMLRDAAHIEAGLDLLMEHTAIERPVTKFLDGEARKNLYADGAP